ncbi:MULTISPECIES: putative leader peptide [unclassified Streptomyces]|uniref:putative leader peptide n=1 Tax=unclassified Streptomyces TaxID=2593676 RepID=UPI00365335E6
MVSHPLYTAVRSLPKPRSQGGAYRLSSRTLTRQAQQPCNNPRPGRAGSGSSRIARSLPVAYLCSVHLDVRLVTRIHVDLLRSASALCL